MDDVLLGLVLERLDHTSPSAAVSDVVLAALEGEGPLAEALDGKARPRPSPADAQGGAVEPAGAYLSSITVSGFRGIGPVVTLSLPSGPGLTVVAGRNGSGKSSFAEGLEVLLTGGLRRWAALSAVWREGWRNLHDGSTPFVQTELVVEGAGPVTVERRWAPEADIDEGEATIHLASGEAGTLEQLGWTAALSEFRPFLCHTELEAFFGRPSDLHGLLASVLGLEDLAGAGERLAAARKTRDNTMKSAKSALDPILEKVSGVDDGRARRVVAALSGLKWDLNAARQASLDAAGQEDDPAASWLQSIANLSVVGRDEVRAAAAALRVAADRLLEVAGTESYRSRELASLLTAAVHHRAHGDGDCPVCGRVGALDETWQQRTEVQIARLEHEAAEADAATVEARATLTAARRLIAAIPKALESSPVAEIDGAAATRAWAAWSNPPGDAGAAGLQRLADHLEACWPSLSATVDALRQQARDALAARQDRWAPVAAEVVAWFASADAATVGAAVVPDIKQAEAWLKAANDEIRNARLAPIAERAIAIWAQLRQESNVDLGAIRLSGSATRARVDIDVTVDGSKAQALGVMSQGEINALALSVFLPRATLPASPFRFLVIDDPVQAMDPAKVDGLARVMAEVAQRRQVIVFTHDDRLPDAIRQLGLPATLLEVTRRPGSTVEVIRSLDPVERPLRDAAALCADTKLPPDVASRVVPGLCRIALEAWLVDTYRSRRLRAGDDRARIDEELDAATRLSQKAALALFDDAGRAGEVHSKLNTWGRAGGDVYQQLNRGAHGVATTPPDRVLADTRWLIGKLRHGLP